MQETKTLTLPISGKTAIIRGYMTGYIDQEIQKITLGANKTHYEVNMAEVQQAIPGQTPQDAKVVIDTDPVAQLQADNKLLELMVLSLDGDSTNILDKVLSLPKPDVDYLKTQLKDVEAASKLTDDSEKKG